MSLVLPRMRVVSDFAKGQRQSSSLPDRGEGKLYSRHLVDRRNIQVQGGRGGNGACAYTKHKKHHMIGPGWPCGGAGGKGGDVVVKTSGQFNSLAHLKGDIQGMAGEPGKKNRINGNSGRDTTVLVPRGVIVREAVLLPDAEEGADKYQLVELADLDELNQTIVVARGGRGGAGNNMARPHVAISGTAGDHKRVELELKTVADVGLVGMPNAGKSTFLSAVSRATPKIAPYPFTTVAPYVGMAEFADGFSFTIADVPGLVEDAHLGAGLGHEFLRHLERTSLLLYVIDAALSTEPFADLLLLHREVQEFSLEMANMPSGVLANKCDLAPLTTLQRVDRLYHDIEGCDETLWPNPPLFVRALSARFGEGVSGLLQEVRERLTQEHVC